MDQRAGVARQWGLCLTVFKTRFGVFEFDQALEMSMGEYSSELRESIVC
jgi:hypothetical protein